MRKVLVVSDSPALRETVEIVLGDQFAVEGIAGVAAPAELPADISLIVVDAEAPTPPGEAPVICIGDTRFRAISPWRRRQYLPATFDALALREAAAMLAGRAAPQVKLPSPSFLAPPFIPAASAPVVARAARSRLPVCVWGEAGTGKLRLARALHAESEAAYLLVASAAELNQGDLRLPPDASPEGDVTAVVAELEDLDAAGQRRLRDALEAGSVATSAGSLAPARIVALSRLDPIALAREGRLGRQLFYQLNVLNVALPPLRQRTEEIPALARTVAATLCESLGLQPVTFTDAAIRRLSRYLWFGNLTELEAVLARSIVFAAKPLLDTADLRFGYGGSAPAEAAAPAGVDRATPARAGNPVDLIIQELAHEFKNPMVTIKTFAHQLDHMLSNGGGYEEFARLTGEAVERMDAALENLVQYTRFQEPSRQPTPLGSIVSSALGGVQDEVADKQLALDVEPTAARVNVDPAQCGYALKNLLRAVVRDLSPGDLLALRKSNAAGLAIEYPARARSAASALSRLVSGDAEGKDAMPLGFAFARSLIERNGGRLDMDREGDVARVTVEFPPVGDGKGENGEAEGPRS